MNSPDYIVEAARNRLHDDDHVFHVMWPPNIPPGDTTWSWCSRDDTDFARDHDVDDPHTCPYAVNRRDRRWLLATREEILNIRPVPTTHSAWSQA